MLYQEAQSIVGGIYGNFYVVTLRHDPTRPPPPLDFEGNSIDHPSVPLAAVTPLADAPRPPIPPLPPDLPPVRPPVPDPPNNSWNTTLICDIERRQWFRVS